MAYIVVKYGGAETRYPVKASVTTIGRALDNDIILNDIKASRKHCQILYTRQGFKVVDLNSNNGTKVGGGKIHEHMLTPGDVIQIGSTDISVIVNAPASSTAKTEPAAPVLDRAAEVHSVQTMVIPSSTGPLEETKAVPKAAPPPAVEQPASASAQNDATPAAGTAVPQKTSKVTARAAGRTGHSIGKTSSMTSRLVHQSKRKKMNPWLKLGVVAGGIVAAVLLIMVLRPTPIDVPKVIGEIKDKTAEAQKLYNKKKFDEAVAAYQDILTHYGEIDEDEIKKEISYVRRYKEDAESSAKREHDGAQAKKSIQEILKNAEGLSSKERLEPLQKADKMAQEALNQYQGTSHEKELQLLSLQIRTMIGNLGKLRDQWEQVRLEARGLANKDKDFAQAMKKLREFLVAHLETGDNEEIRAIKEELTQLIQEVNTLARVYVTETMARVVRDKLEEQKRDEAAAYLQGKKEKIAGTEAESLLDELFKQIPPQ